MKTAAVSAAAAPLPYFMTLTAYFSLLLAADYFFFIQDIMPRSFAPTSSI